MRAATVRSSRNARDGQAGVMSLFLKTTKANCMYMGTTNWKSMCSLAKAANDWRSYSARRNSSWLRVLGTVPNTSQYLDNKCMSPCSMSMMHSSTH